MDIAPPRGVRNRAIHRVKRPTLASSRILLRVSDVVHRSRVLLVAIIYIALISLANYLAFWLRFDGTIPPAEAARGLRMLPWLIAISAIAFIPFDLYRGSWRYTSVWDLRDLVGAVTVSALGFSLLVYAWMGMRSYPRSVIILGGILTISLIGGVRLVRRIVNEMFRPPHGKRVLIIGAGNAGEMIARDLRRKGHEPIGFIDDDLSKRGQSIQRTRVIGSREDLPGIVAVEKPDEVLIAIPSAGPAAIRRFITAVEQFKVPITTLPSLREIVDGKVSVSQVRRVAVEDLLPRAPVHLDTERARDLVEGRRVLITGAGGSIGSELCRQLAALDPDRLILYERYENNLYAVLNTLPRSYRTKPAVGDVTDRRRLYGVIREHRPDVMFHAAAHKHVPLMELNPCEAVKNNVIGTRMVAEAAAQFSVDRFILISTDKAVNPTSLMGATKCAAELVVQAMSARGGPESGTVRFGNVLGSNGSVIPRWLDQIAAGGPVTVTHPDMQRYFMLIPEAVQLILQAATIARGGEIFALEMGEQINLLKMARDLIRLSGFIPDEEIAIAFVGLRPGEKLSEELVGCNEQKQCSPIENILQLRVLSPPDPARVMSLVNMLGTTAVRGDVPAVVDLLCTLVPTFQPGPALTRSAGRRSAAFLPGVVGEKAPGGRPRKSLHGLHGAPGKRPVVDSLGRDGNSLRQAKSNGNRRAHGNGSGQHGNGNGTGNGHGNGNGDSHLHVPLDLSTPAPAEGAPVLLTAPEQESRITTDQAVTQTREMNPPAGGRSRRDVGSIKP
jgi:FlaA1/EpsC-like NDP-sugar epimerase